MKDEASSAKTNWKKGGNEMKLLWIVGFITIFTGVILGEAQVTWAGITLCLFWVLGFFFRISYPALNQMKIPSKTKYAFGGVWIAAFLMLFISKGVEEPLATWLFIGSLIAVAILGGYCFFRLRKLREGRKKYREAHERKLRRVKSKITQLITEIEADPSMLRTARRVQVLEEALEVMSSEEVVREVLLPLFSG